MKTANFNKPTTVKDVAKACNVSIATVSFVINGKSSVRPETRQRVWDAIELLQYRPNAVARSLASQRTHTIGLISNSYGGSQIISHNYSAAIVDGIMKVCHEHNLNLTLFTKPWQKMDPASPWWWERQTDGLVVLAPSVNSNVVRRLHEMDIPLVGIAADSEQLGIPTVDVDNHAGARSATEHLISLGHRRIAHLGGTMTQLSARTRMAVFTAVMAHRGLDVPEGFAKESTFSGVNAAEDTRRLMASPRRPTAIFAAGDNIAVEVIKTARDLGISVPRQLSVIGFDDAPVAMKTNPLMTTIRQPLGEIGGIAARRLIRLINREHVPIDTYLLPPKLILRGSTAPPDLTCL